MKATHFASARYWSYLAFLATFAINAQATVTNIVWYRLGENDPGAAPGLAVTNTTVDVIGGNPLKQFGSPLYTNNVSVDAATGLGSSLAVQFNGASQYLSNSLVSTATNDFGIEAWVNPSTIAGNFNRIIAFNGSITADNGWGLVQRSNLFSAVIGGSATFGAAAAVPGTWTHLAHVRVNGTSRFYVNGVLVSSSGIVRNSPSGAFAVAARPSPAQQFFEGSIDEVRVFQFGAGQFSTNDLLVNVQRVTTLPASNLGPTNVTLNGSANPIGLPTSAWFEWGTTTNFGTLTSPQPLGDGTSNPNFSLSLTGLFGGTYYFRTVASNSLGVAYGTNQSFNIPIFYDIGAGLTNVAVSSVAWGDYDNDGRLDILLTGSTTGSVGVGDTIGQVWRNTGNGFTNIGAGLHDVAFSSVAWGDYDNDGRLDLLLDGIGFNYPPNAIILTTQIWRNTGSGFTNINTGLPGVDRGSAVWGDYDNDGRLDILLTGETTNGIISQIWRNTGNGFVEINAGLTGVELGSVAWGDYDNDGRLDILLTGITNEFGSSAISQVWRNTGSGFTNINAGLPGVVFGSAAWGDYDNDGRLDILLTGDDTNNAAISQVWRNTGNGFTNINAGLPGVFHSSSAWGDYDNDGRLDILLTGLGTNGVSISQIWRNTGGGFTNIEAGLPGLAYGSVAWGDYDNDGRLDILLTGAEPGVFFSQIWRNNSPITNTPPTAPTGLTATISGTDLTLSWIAATDAQTPAAALTYNVRVGNVPGTGNEASPMAAGTGLRRLPQMGNAQQGLSARFNAPLGASHYWSVQAVDTAFTGSPFAPEQRVNVNIVLTPTNGIPVPGDLDGDGIVSQSELDVVLSNYFANSPFLQMTNMAGLGGTNVTFALTNSLAGAFSVEYTTNLMDWLFLGPATPRYLFTDSNAPAVPQRYYRLRWP